MRHRVVPLPTAASLMLAATAAAAPAAAQEWEPNGTPAGAEIRALSAAGSGVLWAGGRGGTFSVSVDGGRTWRSDTVPGAAELFLVDAHAVNRDTAYLLGTHFDGELARIYKTADGGNRWTLQYESARPGTFLDGFAFWDSRSGIAFGDPVDGAFMVVVTEDGGATWRDVPAAALPRPLEGEVGFAASGRAIVTHGDSAVWFGTGGGARARVYHSADRGRTWRATATSLAGGPSAGIFALDFRDPRNGVAVGGDYQDPTASTRNVMRTRDGGASWRVASTSAPAGVRYGVAYVPGLESTIVAVGPSGSGYSTDDGATWTAISDVPYNTVLFVSPSTGWAAGTAGWVARFTGSFPPSSR